MIGSIQAEWVNFQYKKLINTNESQNIQPSRRLFLHSGHFVSACNMDSSSHAKYDQENEPVPRCHLSDTFSNYTVNVVAPEPVIFLMAQFS